LTIEKLIKIRMKKEKSWKMVEGKSQII